MSDAGLAALVGSAEGREWLLAHGVFTDADAFHAALAAPADARAGELAGLGGGRPLVYVGQQVAADFAHATAAKFAAARDLAAAGTTSGTDGAADGDTAGDAAGDTAGGAHADYVIAWHDMDRAGSDRYGLRIVLELSSTTTGAWLAHRSLADHEHRFIPADPQRQEQMLVAAHSAAGALTPAARDRARSRLELLREALADARPQTVADVARALGSELLRAHLAVDLRWIYVSALADAGLLHDVLLDVLTAHGDVVACYNAAVAALVADGLDPHVRPLDESWLPLWWSCPESGRRLRLVRETTGVDVFGAAHGCPCGAEHRISLGGATPSLDELQRGGRWSPDLLLPVLCDHLFSGYVAGRSSAAYGIVMRAVLREALGRAATPAFLPAQASGGHAPTPDSILHAWLLS